MSSSVVLAAVIVLCVTWLGPRLSRGNGTPVRAQVEAPDLQLHAPVHNRQRSREAPSRVVTRVPPHTHERETTAMETPAHTPSATPVRHGSVSGLRIRWDRTIVFLTGILLLVAAVITALVAPFTAVTWAVPLVLLLLGAGCVAGLRYLAVSDRAQRAAAGPVVRSTAPAQHSIFDHEDGARQDRDVQEHAGPAAPELPAQQEMPGTTPARPAAAEPGYSVAELRAMALQVARGSGSEGSSAATWEPVPVPKPLYSQAPVVPRREPEPLQVPTRPAARSASLKDAVRVGERESAALNLDDVLKRRRA